MGTAIIHFCAKNDVNGNPRRVYVLMDDQIGPDGDYRKLAAWDEGYLGYNAVPGDFRAKARAANRVECPVKFYKQVLRDLPAPKHAHEVPGCEHLRNSYIPRSYT